MDNETSVIILPMRPSAVIRTLLGYFLGRDMAETRAMEAEAEKEASGPLAGA